MVILEIIKTMTGYPDLPIKIMVARKKAGLNIKKCAELCGVSRQYLSQLENNRLHIVSADLIHTIESVLEEKLI
jgi:DNA-binding XRE family transcriptional regulator